MNWQRHLAMVILLLMGTAKAASDIPSLRAAGPNHHETRIMLPDVELRDRFGHEQHLTSLLQDRVAIVNFVFADCTAICPLLNATMQQLQKQLQEELGKTVILISISVDPVNDTPEKLLDHANRIGAGEHWHWLTGRPSDINRLLKDFGVSAGGRREDHPPVILVGHHSTQRWLRWVGMPPTETLIDAVSKLSI